MSKAIKIKMGQELVALNGEALRLGGSFGLDGRTIAVVVEEVLNKSQLPSDEVKRLSERLNEVAGKPLCLAEVVCSALLGAYEDEKTLSGSERAKRIELAMRLNRTGMAKVSDSDVKFIMPLIEKCYRGSLLSPQVEALLQGKPFTLGLQEGDEQDEPEEVKPGAGVAP